MIPASRTLIIILFFLISVSDGRAKENDFICQSHGLASAGFVMYEGTDDPTDLFAASYGEGTQFRLISNISCKWSNWKIVGELTYTNRSRPEGIDTGLIQFSWETDGMSKLPKGRVSQLFISRERGQHKFSLGYQQMNVGLLGRARDVEIPFDLNSPVYKGREFTPSFPLALSWEYEGEEFQSYLALAEWEIPTIRLLPQVGGQIQHVKGLIAQLWWQPTEKFRLGYHIDLGEGGEGRQQVGSIVLGDATENFLLLEVRQFDKVHLPMNAGDLLFQGAALSYNTPRFFVEVSAEDLQLSTPFFSFEHASVREVRGGYVFQFGDWKFIPEAGWIERFSPDFGITNRGLRGGARLQYTW